MGGIKKTRPRCGLNLFNELQLSPAELWVRFSSRLAIPVQATNGELGIDQRTTASSRDLMLVQIKHYLQSEIISCKLVRAQKKE